MAWPRLGGSDAFARAEPRLRGVGRNIRRGAAGGGLAVHVSGSQALVGGFLLVAPFVAIVFYALSRQIEQGQKVDGSAAVFAWRRNFGSIAPWGLVLTLALILWERVAAIIFALFYGGEIRDLNTLASDVLFSGRYISLLVVYFGAGGLFALTVFVFGVVTAPLLLDRNVDVVTAALTSLKCCLTNPRAALVWAALIVLLTAVGFATFSAGPCRRLPAAGPRELARVSRHGQVRIIQRVRKR